MFGTLSSAWLVLGLISSVLSHDECVDSAQLLLDSRSSLLKLRLASRSTKALVDAVLFRRLELSDEKSQMLRLLDPNDDLYLHVRHLVIFDYIIRSWTNMSDELGNGSRLEDLESIIGRLRRLQYFR